MDKLHNRLKVELGRKDEIFYYSLKEDPKVSRIAEHGGEYIYRKENIALRSLQVLYMFVLRAEKLPFLW